MDFQKLMYPDSFYFYSLCHMPYKQFSVSSGVKFSPITKIYATEEFKCLDGVIITTLLFQKELQTTNHATRTALFSYGKQFGNRKCIMESENVI